MLDTNTCIHIIKHHPEAIRKKVNRIPVGQIGVSAIVVTELEYGIECSARRTENRQALEAFLNYSVVQDWPADASKDYGRIRASLRKKGTPIGAMDLLIATHSLHIGSILVTDNLREFKRIPGLKLENWVDR